MLSITIKLVSWILSHTLDTFRNKTFTFTKDYIDEIYNLGQEIYKIQEVKKPSHARGAKDALYINRTYFALYSMMAELEATVKTEPTGWDTPLIDLWTS